MVYPLLLRQLKCVHLARETLYYAKSDKEAP
jgi:hypothetical protein